MRARRWLGLLILGICLGGPIAEAFDWWDQPLAAGNDTEASLVVVALSVGLAVAVAAAVVHWFQSFASRSPLQRWLVRPPLVSTVTLAPPCPSNSPPAPLRI
jgi:hypothetical protein